MLQLIDVSDKPHFNVFYLFLTHRVFDDALSNKEHMASNADKLESVCNEAIMV
jgi:hypothetical protein